jgi:hypothetical protein
MECFFVEAVIRLLTNNPQAGERKLSSSAATQRANEIKRAPGF